MRHANAAQGLIHTPLALGRRHTGAVRERQLDVLIHRQVANQVETLKDETNLLIANA